MVPNINKNDMQRPDRTGRKWFLYEILIVIIGGLLLDQLNLVGKIALKLSAEDQRVLYEYVRPVPDCALRQRAKIVDSPPSEFNLLESFWGRHRLLTSVLNKYRGLLSAEGIFTESEVLTFSNDGYLVTIEYGEIIDPPLAIYGSGMLCDTSSHDEKTLFQSETLTGEDCEDLDRIVETMKLNAMEATSSSDFWTRIEVDKNYIDLEAQFSVFHCRLRR